MWRLGVLQFLRVKIVSLAHHLSHYCTIIITFLHNSGPNSGCSARGKLIGASLSEPHPSELAVHSVCLYIRTYVIVRSGTWSNSLFHETAWLFIRCMHFNFHQNAHVSCSVRPSDPARNRYGSREERLSPRRERGESSQSCRNS